MKRTCLLYGLFLALLSGGLAAMQPENASWPAVQWKELTWSETPGYLFDRAVVGIFGKHASLIPHAPPKPNAYTLLKSGRKVYSGQLPVDVEQSAIRQEKTAKSQDFLRASSAAYDRAQSLFVRQPVKQKATAQQEIKRPLTPREEYLQNEKYIKSQFGSNLSSEDLLTFIGPAPGDISKNITFEDAHRLTQEQNQKIARRENRVSFRKLEFDPQPTPVYDPWQNPLEKDVL